jgi:hypothetical protein
MPVENQDRPIDMVREEVIDQLIVNYGHEKSIPEIREFRTCSRRSSTPIALSGLDCTNIYAFNQGSINQSSLNEQNLKATADLLLFTDIHARDRQGPGQNE